jgi:enoyl-CoA hydratase/carnithine racemase
MGHAKANDMLFLGTTFTAAEFHSANMLTRVFQNVEDMKSCVTETATRLASEVSWEAVSQSRELVKRYGGIGALAGSGKSYRDLLLEVNEREMKLLFQRMTSPEFTEALLKFKRRKKKAKI